MDNQHRKIKGYRELSKEDIALMNSVKQMGIEIQGMFDDLETRGAQIDRRWLDIGKTDIQKGLMAVVRSIAKPEFF